MLESKASEQLDPNGNVVALKERLALWHPGRRKSVGITLTVTTSCKGGTMKLFHDATFIPMTGEHDRFEALVADEAGSIAFTGSYADAIEYAPGAERIDLAGATVLPGFIDPHSHFTMTAQSLAYIQLAGATTIAELLDLLRQGMGQRGRPALRAA